MVAEASPRARAQRARGAARKRRRGPLRPRPAPRAGSAAPRELPTAPRAAAPPRAAPQLGAAEPSLLGPQLAAPRAPAEHRVPAARLLGLGPAPRGAPRRAAPGALPLPAPRPLTVLGGPVRRRQLLVRLEVLGLGLLAPRHAASGARARRGAAASAGRPAGTARGAHGAEQLGW